MVRQLLPLVLELVAQDGDQFVAWVGLVRRWYVGLDMWFVGLVRRWYASLSRWFAGWYVAWFAAWYVEAYQEPAALAPAFERTPFDARSDGTLGDAELMRRGGDVGPLWYAGLGRWFAGWYAGWIRWYVAWYVGGSPVHGTHGTPKQSRPEP